MPLPAPGSRLPAPYDDPGCHLLGAALGAACRGDVAGSGSTTAGGLGDSCCRRGGCWFAGGWAGRHVLVLPAARAVVVTPGEPHVEFGPPPRDALPPDWRPALDRVRSSVIRS